jgi:hypothetical protein
MFSLENLKAGDFIDVENYYFQMVKHTDTPDVETATKFYKILVGGLPKREKDYLKILEEFQKQLLEIKETYIWIYNPPQLPSSTEQHNPSPSDSLKQEFAEDYGGYIEIIYLLCSANLLNVNKVLKMKAKDFLFWGEYAVRKRLIESVK